MGSYTGINQYASKGKLNRTIINKSLTIIFCLFAFVATFSIGAVLFREKEVNLKKIDSKIIEEYIIVSEDISKGKPEISWQELAAVNGAIQEGKFEIKDKENLKLIGSKFYKESKDGIKIKKFADIVSDMKLSNNEKNEATNLLNSIKGNVINEELVNDRSKEKFIKDIEELAIENYNTYKILPSVTIAQAILESGWGESELAQEHKNLFGIKADKRWNGKTAKIETKENHDDVVEAFFRKYDSIENSIEDHGKFLSENQRYSENGVFNSVNYVEQAQALEKAGYSTSKDSDGNLIYADKLIRVIRQNNLMLYDSELFRE